MAQVNLPSNLVGDERVAEKIDRWVTVNFGFPHYFYVLFGIVNIVLAQPHKDHM